VLPCARCRCPCTCRRCSSVHRLSPLWNLSLSLITFVLFFNDVGYVVPWITSFSRSSMSPCLAWSHHDIPSLDLAVMFHLLLSRSYAYGSGSTSLYLEGRGLVLALPVTVPSLWVREGGVGSRHSCWAGDIYNVVALESARQCCIRHVSVGINTSAMHNYVLGRSPLFLFPSNHVERRLHIARKRERARDVVVLVPAVRELWNVRVVSKVKKEYTKDLLDIFEVLPRRRGVYLGLRL